MVPRRGDQNDAVRHLQRALNKLGALLLLDGDFGPGTEAAVAEARVTLGRPGPAQADDDLLQALAALPEPSPELTAPGATFIGREEVSSPRSTAGATGIPCGRPPTAGSRSGSATTCAS